MDAKTLDTLDQILGEVSAHPILRAKERMVAAHQRGGLDELIKATEKRINATKDRDKLEGIAAALAELAAHGLEAAAKNRVEKLTTKVSEKLSGMKEEIAQLDAGLSELSQDTREDVLVAMLIRGHEDALGQLEHSLEAFDEVVSSAALYAYHSGLFGEATYDEVAEALADDLLEFLPALIKGAGAVGRAVGKTAAVVAKGAKAVGRAAHGVARVGKAFGRGVKAGYKGSKEVHVKGKSGSDKPKAAPQTKPLAKKVADTGRKMKLKHVGYQKGAKPKLGKSSGLKKIRKDTDALAKTVHKAQPRKNAGRAPAGAKKTAAPKSTMANGGIAGRYKGGKTASAAN